MVKIISINNYSFSREHLRTKQNRQHNRLLYRISNAIAYEPKLPIQFYVPANAKQEIIKVPEALQVDTQTNLDWVLRVRDLNGESASGDGKVAFESLCVRADGKTFTSLDEKDINLIKGNRGAQGNTGKKVSIDYELNFKMSEKIRNYQINLLNALVAI